MSQKVVQSYLVCLLLLCDLSFLLFLFQLEFGILLVVISYRASSNNPKLVSVLHPQTLFHLRKELS